MKDRSDERRGTHHKIVAPPARLEPLEWIELQQIRKGNVLCSVQRAFLNSGKAVFSFSLSRAPSKEGQRASKYFRMEDSGDIAEVIKATQDLIASGSVAQT